MGGIVAAETLILLASEKPIPASSSRNSTIPNQPNLSSNTAVDSDLRDGEESIGYLFPHIQAVLAFDTPYLGLAPEMVAYGLEGGHKMATGAWETANEVASIFGWGSKNGSATSATPTAATAKSIGALPAPDSSVDAAAAPKWQSWGKYAMFAGAAGAVAAGGAAALYSQREKISEGWGWATSHLLFVGDLAKAEVLRKRVEAMERTVRERRLGGCGCFYTNLGRGAREGYGITEKVSGRDRTFCNLPRKVKERNNEIATSATTSQRGDNEGTIDSTNQAEKGKLRWMKAVNDKAKDETTAHMSMFFPRENPGFYTLGERATEVIGDWIDQQWYESATGRPNDAASEPEGSTFQAGSLGKDWEGLDKHEIHADEDDVEMREEHKEHEAELEDSVMIETKSLGDSTHLKKSASEGSKIAGSDPISSSREQDREQDREPQLS